MSYLAERNFVHRDLAARNCLLDERLRVKVSDFGMTRQLIDKSYYRSRMEKPMPRRWMAIESLDRYVFTTKSDVWSYGVLVWELWSKGATPHLDVPSSELLLHLKRGHRLTKPNSCPNSVYELCLTCWDKDRELRPDFEIIKKKLEICMNDIFCAAKPVYLNEDEDDHLLL